MAKVPEAYRNAVHFAAREIAAHPAITLLGEPVFHAEGATIMAEIDLRYGAKWRARRQSPTGVLPREEVRFEFPLGFPSNAPKVSLRPDFSRNHPHIQPWLGVEGRVVPCVLNGPVGEFIAARGFYDFVAQVLDWLQGAAEGRLMNLKQGWEPARRDSFHDELTADVDAISALVDRKGGFKLFSTSYFCRWSESLTPYFLGELKEETNVKANCRENRLSAGSNYAHGEGLALIVWPGRGPDGTPTVCGEYVPDDVSTVADLYERARLYGVEAELRAGLALMRGHAKGLKPMTFPLVVTLLARRPARVLGTASNIEVCSYLTPNTLPAGPMTDPGAPVRPLSIRQAISPALLRRMGGESEWPSWALLGCGSLGSKVAMHAARSGNAPALVADKAALSPHNSARHALYPQAGSIGSTWLSRKATKLAEALSGLGRPVEALEGDHLALASHIEGIRPKARKPKVLLNTTASLVVRESLGSSMFETLPQIIDMSLFDSGSVGYIGIEGAGRNPNCVELIASLYQHASSDDILRKRLLETEHMARVVTGQGCGSLTMIATDARLSVMAAAMTEVLMVDGAETSGALHLFQRDGLSTLHSEVQVDPFIRVPIDGLEGWSLSISASVYDRMLAEITAWPKTETGGVLMGWSSAIAQRVVVTDLIDAPADSRRSATEFVLGTDGLSERFAEFGSRSAGLLRCTGTWHSHLGPATPSGTDKNSAQVVTAFASLPLVFLISGTDGLRAISCAPELPAKEVTGSKARSGAKKGTP